MEMFPDIISEIVYSTINPDKAPEEWDLEALNNALEKKLFPKDTNLVDEKFVQNCDCQDLIQKIMAEVERRYNEKIELFKEHQRDFSDLERYILLRVVDSLWMDHIDQMNQLRNEIGLQSYGQHDPIVAYKKLGFEMFESMVSEIREKTALFLLNIKIETKSEPRQVAKPIEVVEQKTARAEPKAGRNAPCPCGSGKKYKNCCGRK